MSDESLPFRAEENALVRFGDPGSAPLLNYNVPQPAEYNGRYFLDLTLPAGALLPPPKIPEPKPPKPSPKPTPEPSPEPSPSEPGRLAGTDYSIKAINDLVSELVAQVDLADLAKPLPPIDPGPIPGQPNPPPVPELPGGGFDPVPPFDRIVDAALSRLPSIAGGLADLPEIFSDSVIKRRLKELKIDPKKYAVRPAAAAQPLAAVRSLVPGARPAYLRRLDALVGRTGAFQFAKRIRRGERLVETRTMNGEVRYELREAIPAGAPRFAIIHQCRMSSFLGEYGAGRTISTFSLLPGEKHEIEVKTYKRTKTKQTEASSILDSYEEETADEFQADLTQESSTATSQDASLAATANAQASATWGWGSGSASGSITSNSASKREDFAKNVASSTQKHAAKAAAKRQLEVNTTSETETEEGEERALKRTIENINVGRTLNFVMRQMNQVFVSVLAITDIRLGYSNGNPGHYQEFTLPELNDFLEMYVILASRAGVKAMIWNALFMSFDWQAELRPLVEAMAIKHDEAEGLITDATITPSDKPLKASFWRFPRQTTELNRNRDGVEVTLPGVVLAVTRSILPTDGVIVEALLGQGNALDAYSLGLQMEAVRDKLGANDRTQAETDLLRQKMQVAADNDKERAAILQGLFSPATGGNG